MALLSAPLKKRVQTFLTESGAPPRAELTRNYQQIFVMMQRRREDDAFWAPLTGLLRELVDSVAKSKNPNVPLPPEARFLALWDVNELAQLLRAALPHEPQPAAGITEPSPGNQWFRFSRGLSPNALGLLLLLSLAASACGSSDSHTGVGNTGVVGGTAATGGAGNSLTTGGNTSLGGDTSTATGGSSSSGGISGLGGNGGTAENTGGAVAVGGATLGGTAATDGTGGSPTTGGNTALGGDTSAVTGGSSHSGGTEGLGGNGGTVSTVTGGSSHNGGTQSLGGNGGTVSTVTGGSSNNGGTQSLGGTVGNTGGYTATGGAALTCQRDAGSAAGATAVAGHPLPPNCCVDTASALWQAIDGSTLDSTQKQTLYTCFVNLNNTWCDGLVDLFKTATPQVIADYLSDLLPCCQVLPSRLSVEFATLQQELINRTICNVVLYKGVTFPS